jgi:hypothetical protein
MSDPKDVEYTPKGRIESWERLCELVSEYQDDPRVYRGVPRHTFKLVPTNGRPDFRKQAKPYKSGIPFDPLREVTALRQFKQEARPYINPLPEDDIEWLAIAQHHGMPTRLLDWTRGIFVAAYFAVSEPDTKIDAGLYALRKTALMPFGYSEQDAALGPEETRFYDPPHINPRIAAQQGLFTVAVDPVKAFHHTDLDFWLISGKCCFDIKRKLDTCGINQASLFPDLIGLAQNAGWRYKWGF